MSVVLPTRFYFIRCFRRVCSSNSTHWFRSEFTTGTEFSQTFRRQRATMDRFLKRDPQSTRKQSNSSHGLRSATAEDEVLTEKERYLKMKLTEKRKLYKCGDDYKTLKDIPTWPEYAADRGRKLQSASKTYSSRRASKGPMYKVNEELNEKVSMFRTDITALEIDAIVNAANNSLLGGGGVDGAIHSAAGGLLKKECMTLKRCDTGDAKITCGYKLPARYVIHTVGPIGEHPKPLEGCYHRCLELVKENKLKSVAFPCISTGIYGYPVDAAAHVALRTIREWLETETYAQQIERIVMCLFLKKDIEVYEELMQVYFPLKTPGEDRKTVKEEKAASGVKETKDADASSDEKDPPASTGAAQQNASNSADGSPVDKSEGQRDKKQKSTPRDEDQESSPAAKKRTPPPRM